MAALEDPEPMEVGPSVVLSDEKVRFMLSLTWSEKLSPHKKTSILTKRLQTWLTKLHYGITICELLVKSKEHAIITVQPPVGFELRLPALQKLVGITLTSNKQGKNEADVTITSVSLLEMEKDSESASTSPPDSVTEPPLDPILVCDTLYMYVQNKYKDDLHRLLEENGVMMTAEVNVTFKAKHQNGNVIKARSEYTDLIQRSWPECIMASNQDNGAGVPGPSGGQNGFDGGSVVSSQPTSLHTSLLDSYMEQQVHVKVKMTIRDDLLQDGLSVDEDSWNQISSSYPEQIERIKLKFKVDFKSSITDGGAHTVKASYNNGGANASMESHAIRALLRLYQKMATSSPNHNLGIRTPGQASASTAVVPWSAEGASGGVTPEKSEDQCPICQDNITMKTTLVCQHSFCETCIQRSTEAMGPICPLCRNVFGAVEGNQPEGTMKASKSPTNLPGFPNCGTIIIHYHIPGGKQTKKHPEPGTMFCGTQRTAYLPDNEEGNEVLHLLERAFKQKLIFTIGRSRTTGVNNQVTWNDIHHKTNIDGGPERYGYPDPHYLQRVKEELKAKGIK